MVRREVVRGHTRPEAEARRTGNEESGILGLRED